MTEDRHWTPLMCSLERQEEESRRFYRSGFGCGFALGILTGVLGALILTYTVGPLP